MSYFEERGDPWGINRSSSTLRAPRGSYRPSPIFLGILAAFVLFSALAWSGSGSDGVNVFFIVISGWLLSLCVHEFAHAIVAFKSGDVTVPGRGYLTLNPLKYAHWLLSIALPVLFIIAGGIALPGGAVMIDHQYIRDRRKESAISLAGPAVNLVFGFALILPFLLGVDGTSHPVLWAGYAYLAFFQFMAGIFNLLPIPGLDGGNAILPWLSRSWQRGFNAVRPYGFFIVLLLLWQSSFGRSLVDHIATGMFSAGVPQDSFFFGQHLFRFWSNNG